MWPKKGEKMEDSVETRSLGCPVVLTENIFKE
jgi:hypothetical protein